MTLLRFHHLLSFWDTEYACHLDVSAMFGEHYGLLHASSRALIDLKNELQSACMSTKLNQIGWTWNLSNISKFVGNRKKLQLQKLFQITHYFSTNFLGIFVTP
jgi:hypothetical protein